jgi:hypothetical protein
MVCSSDTDKLVGMKKMIYILALSDVIIGTLYIYELTFAS